MKNRKGYTLVEVLAVIAIIAIVLVIGVPRVNKMINTSRKKAFETNVMSVINAVKNHYQSNFYGSLDATKTIYDVEDESIIQSGNIIDYTEGKLDFEGEIRINEDGKLRASLRNDKYCAIKNYSTELAVYEVGENDECTLGNEGEKSLLVVNLNGGITSQTFNNTYDAGTVITLIEPTRAGYAFDGWELLEGDSTLSDNTLTIGGLDTKIQALWESLPHNLIVNLDGGILDQALKSTYNTGELIELNNPRKEGKYFTGWIVSSGNSILSGNTLTMGSTDATITAQYLDCVGGTYNDGTSSSCKICLGGTYSGVGQASCTSCAAGTYSSAGQTNCTQCSGGTYSSAGQASCTQCPSGTYSGSGQASCTSCASGTYSGSGQTSCTTCPVGTYSDVGASGCTSCAGGSGAGLETCSIVCGAGTYLEAGATSCSECSAGNYCLGGTYTYSNEIDQGITGICSAGTYSEGGASTSSCQECPAGTYSNPGAASCLICTGAYTSESGASSCDIPCSNSTGVASWSDVETCTVVSCDDIYSKDGNKCELNSPVLSYQCANGSAGSSPYVMTYTGNCTMGGTETNWKVKFLTSGTLTFKSNIAIDAFLVGGGGGGGGTGTGNYHGGGGGGGYTASYSNLALAKATGYPIVVGAGGAASKSGGASSAFGKSASGGSGGSNTSSAGVGGAGGSGGGGNTGTNGSAGGSNGGNGGSSSGGKGQGTSTREFWSIDQNTSATLYSGGGGGGGWNKGGAGGSGGGASGRGSGENPLNHGKGYAASANTGGGGGAGYTGGGAGGSGIVVIRATTVSFYSQTLNSGTIYTAYTSNPFTGVSNGTGNYTYTIKSGAPSGATINSANRTISFPNTTNAGRYYVVVTATDNASGTTIDATMTIDINLVVNPYYSYSCANSSSGTAPYLITYTGNCLMSGASYEYKLKFLTSGNLTVNNELNVDAFLVGGGGGGGGTGTGNYHGGGGGGGYTTTALDQQLSPDTTYAITIGAGGAASSSGGKTTAFGYSALGGSGGSNTSSAGVGGAGGSGGGGNTGSDGSAGGSNGGNGGSSSGGKGQGTTTREFGESTGILYAGGGGGGGWNHGGAGGAGGGANGRGSGENPLYHGKGYSASANTGGGGGAGYTGGGAGGSGVVVIRNKR